MDEGKNKYFQKAKNELMVLKENLKLYPVKNYSRQENWYANRKSENKYNGNRLTEVLKELSYENMILI